MDRRKNKKKNQPHKGNEQKCRPQEPNPRPQELNPRPQELNPRHHQLGQQPAQEEEACLQSLIECKCHLEIHLEIRQEQ